jgi:hypothetical protein
MPAAWQIGAAVDDTGARDANKRKHFDRLDMRAQQATPDAVQIATEGALWGSIHAGSFLRDTVVVSDDVGQFAVGLRALCWIHAERLVHKLGSTPSPTCIARRGNAADR